MDPLAGVDVKGKVVVVYAEPSPKGMSFRQLRATGKQGVDWMDPAAYAKQNGAVGVIVSRHARNSQFVGPRSTAAGDRRRYFVEKLRDCKA